MLSSGPLQVMGAVLSIFRLALRHSARNGRLMVAPLLGLVVAAGLVSTIPLYSYGALDRLLQARVAGLITLPPGVVWVKSMFYFPKPENVDQYRRLNDFMVNHSANIIGLPQQTLVRYVASDAFLIWPYGPDGPDRNYPRRMASLVAQHDFMKHVRIVEGEGLPDGPAPAGADVPVIISPEAAATLDLQVGERIAFTNFADDNPPTLPLRIVGLWEPLNPTEDFWLYDPASYTNSLMITEEALLQNAVPTIPLLLRELSWYGVYDQTRLSALNAERVLSGLEYLESQARLHVTSTQVETTLRRTLPEYTRQAYILSTVMFVLSVPTVAVVLYFIGISMAMVVERQRSEIALLKSRGASTLQVTGIYVCEVLILGAVALVVGPVLGEGIAQLVGQTVGFMQFARRPPVPLALNLQAIQLAAGVALLAVPATIQPAISAAKHSIVGYKRETARFTRRPGWQLLPVAFVLLAIAAYGYRMLQQQQSIMPLGKDESFVVDPLLIVVPAVFVFGVALLLVQVFPLVMAGLARLVGVLPGPTVALSLAIRQIARTPAQHSSLVLLLTLTLAMGAYSASTAQTIDRNFTDRVLYDIPGDLELWEYWRQDEDSGIYEEPPFEYHYVPEVQGVAPFMAYKVEAKTGRASQSGSLVAINRLEYPKAAWWRDDFADKPLGALMNALGANEAATIVSRTFLEQSGLRIGDPYTLSFDSKPVEFYVAEVADYFPTLYPEKGPFFVANLDYVFDKVGIQPYRVWVDVKPGVRSADAVDAMRAAGVGIVFIRDSRVTINEQRTDPQRTGLFGVLTVGFGVAALLTVLGFFLYASLSFQRRLVQMGILRAMGLSVGQLLLVLFFEQLLLIALGVAFGTGLGLVTNSLFIPFLQVGTEGQTPRFVVQTPWADLQRVYVVLGLMLLAGLASTAWLVKRMKLYQVVKMGEEQ